MRKKSIALLLSLIISALLPFTAAATEEDRLRTAVTKEYDAFTASIAQPNAHNNAVARLVRYSLQRPTEDLVMDETDAFTASMLNSVLFRNYMIDALTAGLQIMKNENEAQSGTIPPFEDV